MVGVVAAVVLQPLCQQMLTAAVAQLLYNCGAAPVPPQAHQRLQKPLQWHQKHKTRASCACGCCCQLMACSLEAFQRTHLRVKVRQEKQLKAQVKLCYAQCLLFLQAEGCLPPQDCTNVDDLRRWQCYWWHVLASMLASVPVTWEVCGQFLGKGRLCCAAETSSRFHCAHPCCGCWQVRERLVVACQHCPMQAKLHQVKRKVHQHVAAQVLKTLLCQATLALMHLLHVALLLLLLR